MLSQAKHMSFLERAPSSKKKLILKLNSTLLDIYRLLESIPINTFRKQFNDLLIEETADDKTPPLNRMTQLIDEQLNKLQTSSSSSLLYLLIFGCLLYDAYKKAENALLDYLSFSRPDYSLSYGSDTNIGYSKLLAIAALSFYLMSNRTSASPHLTQQITPLNELKETIASAHLDNDLSYLLNTNEPDSLDFRRHYYDTYVRRKEKENKPTTLSMRRS